MSLPCQRHLFEIPEDITYLNCAYMAPNLRAVREAGQVAVSRKSAPWAITVDDFFSDAERIRSLVAGLIGADADGVALIPSVSYGVGTAALNLPLCEGQRVIVLGEEFPSNYYPWKEAAGRAGAAVVVVERPPEGDVADALCAAIDERAAVVAVPQCHWTDGLFVDLERVASCARSAGAALVVDLSQSLGALPFDVSAVRPDFVVTVGYKWLLGPYSQSYMWAAPDRRDGTPIEFNWITRAGSEDFASLVTYRDDFRAGARRYDVGEMSNFVLLPMAVAALEHIADWGPDRIAASIRPLTERAANEALEIGFSATARHAAHLIGLRRPGGLRKGLGEALAREGIYVSVRGDSIRVGPHLYNTEGDIGLLVDALRRLA